MLRAARVGRAAALDCARLLRCNTCDESAGVGNELDIEAIVGARGVEACRAMVTPFVSEGREAELLLVRVRVQVRWRKCSSCGTEDADCA